MYALSKLYSECCKWLILFSKFHLQWCIIKWLNYCWIVKALFEIATTIAIRLKEKNFLMFVHCVPILNNNIIGIEYLFFKITSFFSPHHLHEHDSLTWNLVLCNYAICNYMWLIVIYNYVLSFLQLVIIFFN